MKRLYRKLWFWLRCLIFGKTKTKIKYMAKLHDLLNELNELNNILIPLLNSDQKDSDEVKDLKLKRNHLNIEIEKHREENLYKYIIEFDYFIKFVESDNEFKHTQTIEHFSEINVNYNSLKEGLNPSDSKKHQLVSEIFNRLKDYDLSKTDYFVIFRVK